MRLKICKALVTRYVLLCHNFFALGLFILFLLCAIIHQLVATLRGFMRFAYSPNDRENALATMSQKVFFKMIPVTTIMSARQPNRKTTHSTTSSLAQKLLAKFKLCKNILNLLNLRHLKMYLNT